MDFFQNAFDETASFAQNAAQATHGAMEDGMNQAGSFAQEQAEAVKDKFEEIQPKVDHNLRVACHIAGILGKQAADNIGEGFENGVDWVKKNPETAAALAVSLAGGIAVIAVPSLVTVPLLGVVGFGPGGVIAGSLAAAIQSSIGSVAAGSLFAFLTSAAAGGAAAAVVAGAVQATAAIATVGGVSVIAARAFGGDDKDESDMSFTSELGDVEWKLIDPE